MEKRFLAKWYNSALSMAQSEVCNEERLNQIKGMPFVHAFSSTELDDKDRLEDV